MNDINFHLNTESQLNILLKLQNFSLIILNP